MSYPIFGNSTKLETAGGLCLEQLKIKLAFDFALNSWEPLHHLDASTQTLAFIVNNALGSDILLPYL